MSRTQNVRGQRSDIKHTATTRQLTRIITVLSMQRVPRNSTWIIENCCVDSSKIRDALNWLACNRIVFKHKTVASKGMWMYSINPAFAEMRGVGG